MLYKKNTEDRLSEELFRSPTAEYRGTPFWAWNTKLEKEELLWQIEQLKAMGFGGFHMHPRAGFATEYLGKEYMELISACNEKAKAEEMLAWLYDEDRWPSGFGGGLVTEDPRHRQKFMLFTVKPMENTVDRQTGYETGKPYLLAAYDVVLGSDGTLAEYHKIGADGEARGVKWFVYVCTQPKTGRYNGNTYVDTMSPEAIDEFIRITHEAYKRAVGSDFGGSIPAIFTDEPQFATKMSLPFASSKIDIKLPYTTDFAETFEKEYGIDLTEHLPELVWDLPNGAPSRVRYLYHDHACERFTRAFSDRIGKWCDENGILLTGHMMREDTLDMQTDAVGEAMRGYRGFGLPGIDLLCDEENFATAKQCQSAVHQYGREGMLSELYGVTGWDFDFRGHKYQGDWQAALGVTVRVPHLSWVSMKGSAKRDYPASISYQSAWYKEYPYIEDHFARLNTALTRGKPVVRVAVVHPIESYWLCFGPQESAAAKRIQLQKNFDTVTNALLFGMMDFDYISEALLPDLYTPSTDGKLHVGEMAYDAVVMPGLETVRSTTLDALEHFRDAGGKLVFMGDCPRYVDAVISERAKALYTDSEVIAFTEDALLGALAEVREVSVKDERGFSVNDMLYQLRQDGESRWFFLGRGKHPHWTGRIVHLDQPPRLLRISFDGEYTVTVYDTMTGNISPACFEAKDGHTVVQSLIYEQDSLLLRLDPVTARSGVSLERPRRPIKRIDFKNGAEYALGEPNVMVLDMAQLSWDGEHFEPIEEILRIDKAIRSRLGFPMADGQDIQPWLIEEEKIEHYPYLKFTFKSETEALCKLGYEEAVEIRLNGVDVPICPDGYFTDKSIHTTALPALRKGTNELIVRAPIGKRLSLENYFLLGEFGVRTVGYTASVTTLPERLHFGDLASQGLPFYGAAVTYKTEFELDGEHDIAVRCEYFKGTVVGVKLDGRDMGRIAISPYKVFCNGVAAGRHTLELTLYVSRVNCFGGLHNCAFYPWIGPAYWYSEDTDWSYEYILKDTGILKSPIIEVY